MKVRWSIFLISLLIFSLFTSIFSYAKENIIYIDIKKQTKYALNLLPIEIGVEHFLKATKNPIIVPVEFSEDYTIKLTNYKKEEKDGNIEITLTIELRTRSGIINKGRLLKKKDIKIVFKKDAPIPQVIKIDDKIKNVLEKLKMPIEEIEREAFFGGAKVTEEIVELIKEEENVRTR